MFEKSAWSACSHSSNKWAWEMGRRPSLTALVMMDCNRCLSEASMNPHQTGEAYSNLLISVAWVTSHRALSPSSCDFRTLRAKKVWAHRLIRLSIWGLNERWSWTVTPRTTIWLTLCIPWIGGGGKLASLDPGLRIIISVDFFFLTVLCLKRYVSPEVYNLEKTMLVSFPPNQKRGNKKSITDIMSLTSDLAWPCVPRPLDHSGRIVKRWGGGVEQGFLSIRSIFLLK